MTKEILIAKLDESRQWFLKVVDGLTEEQWDAKPYPTVKSPKETLAHLIIDDRALATMMEGKEPDYEAYAPDPNLRARQLLELLAETHREKLAYLSSYLEGKDLEGEIDTVYFGRQPLWWEVLSVVTEDWYHIGQVSLVRQGVDPSWDYYAALYGGG